MRSWISVIVLAAIIFSTTDCGIDLGAGGQGGGASPGRTVDASRSYMDDAFDSQVVGQTSLCNAGSNTPIPPWHLTFTDNSTYVGQLFYPMTSSGTVQIATQTLHSGNPAFAAINGAAISEWGTTLASRVKYSHSYNAIPVEDPNNAVDPYITENWNAVEQPSDPMTIAQTFLSVLNDGTILSGTAIQFYANRMSSISTDDGRYTVALHELGHAQGLGHNPDIGSIMFPTSDGSGQAPTQCYFYNGGGGRQTAPIDQDTQNLEHHYDPIVFPTPLPRPSGCSPLPGKPLPPGCLSAVRPPGTAASPTSGRITVSRGLDTAWSSSLSPAQASSVRAAIDSHSRTIHAEDTLGAKTLRADTMFAISPIIVRARMIRTAEVVRDTGSVYPIQTLDVEAVFADRLHEHIKIGQPISVVEEALPSLHEFSDDPLLKPGDDVVLFLRRAQGNINLLSRRHLYVAEAPFSVAKWIIKRGRYDITPGTQVARDISGRPAVSALNAPTAAFSARIATSQQSILIRQRVVPTPRTLELLADYPLDALRLFSRHDANNIRRQLQQIPLL